MLWTSWAKPPKSECKYRLHFYFCKRIWINNNLYVKRNIINWCTGYDFIIKKWYLGLIAWSLTDVLESVLTPHSSFLTPDAILSTTDFWLPASGFALKYNISFIKTKPVFNRQIPALVKIGIFVFPALQPFYLFYVQVFNREN